MSLSNEQRAFTYKVGKLIIFAYDELNAELTFGDAYRDPRLHGEFGVSKGYGAKASVHKLRLAVDFNLFFNGKYVTSSSHKIWKKLHSYWCAIGGAETINNDANHFSCRHRGHR